MIIGFMLNNLRSHEIDRPTAGFGRILNNLSEAKITNFTSICSIFVPLKKDILAFKISVYNIPLMNGLHTNHYLMEDSKSFVKAKYSLGQFGLVLKEIPQITVLHNDKVITTI